MPDRSFGDTPRTLPLKPILIVAVLLVLLVSAKFLSSLAIDLEWWQEMHQIETWISIFLYGSVPIFGVAVLYFIAFWTAYRLGLGRADPEHRAGTTLNRLIAGALAVLSILLANIMVDSWTVVRYIAGLRLPPPIPNTPIPSSTSRSASISLNCLSTTCCSASCSPESSWL